MTTLAGVGVGQGLAVGPAFRMPDPPPDPPSVPSTIGVAAERASAANALAATAEDLRTRATTVGGTAAAVLHAQALIVEDPMLRDEVDARIDEGGTAARAVHEAFGVFRDMLAGLGGYLGERAGDLEDLSRRTVARITGDEIPSVPRSDTPFVLVARDVAVADLATLDDGVVRAIVTSDGGRTSHAAILAAERGLPAVVGVAGALDIVDGATVIVDARTGLVHVSPTAHAVAVAEQTLAERAARVPSTAPGALADGIPIPLLANLGSSDGIGAAVAAGAEGVGLLRTEFLFLGASVSPTVDTQREAYAAVLRAFPGRKIVVRVLDAGGDKPLPFLSAAEETNPALGRRGIRALRASESILRDQLRALAQADADHDAEVWVMAPMVATVDETRYFSSLAREFGLRTAGVMIEVPAAALLADRILAECDFASIGTNDLTQYTMAADRLLSTVQDLQDPWHPAVLRLVNEVGSAGAARAIPVGACGEAAADPRLAVVLVGLGVTSLSMSAPAIADVRDELGRWTLEGARDAARAALGADDAAGARAAVERVWLAHAGRMA